ncbi:hypothetical protein CC1G_15837 [Coprinopsis cinerea okayama7|uniref:Uncharacterized protein n=1 Tax=Coprinopsis cinerea (strain Okayama-7 / 130 / ATCC MYA-4618 / FGSC 9003) TaxID=240176 RepID=D6RR31_COPC7|nr:hypothetical protein CC1G_15837 [Coprinopsis cinerea okayama7\|eukprot:XP_002910027.1 hypothetical protein CC1G_15837 [Coprinopsis cinerea okayama7\
MSGMAWVDAKKGLRPSFTATSFTAWIALRYIVLHATIFFLHLRAPLCPARLVLSTSLCVVHGAEPLGIGTEWWMLGLTLRCIAAHGAMAISKASTAPWPFQRRPRRHGHFKGVRATAISKASTAPRPSQRRSLCHGHLTCGFPTANWGIQFHTVHPVLSYQRGYSIPQWAT